MLAVLYLVFADAILAMFGGTVNAETYHHSQEYFFYITLGVPFYMFGQAMNPIIRADGSPRFAKMCIRDSNERACKFNMDTGCVELLLRDGRKISIDCTGVEDALDVIMAQRSELDYLIYNDPLGYADLILNGDPEEYLKNVAGSHGLED